MEQIELNNWDKAIDKLYLRIKSLNDFEMAFNLLNVMNEFISKTRKYNQLIEMYSLMANNGYKRNDGILYQRKCI